MSEMERLRKLMEQASAGLPLYEARNILPRRDNGWTVFDRADPDPTRIVAAMMDERTAKLLVAAPIMLRWLENLARASSPTQQLEGNPKAIATRNTRVAATMTNLLPGLEMLREFIERKEGSVVAFPDGVSEAEGDAPSEPG